MFSFTTKHIKYLMKLQAQQQVMLEDVALLKMKRIQNQM